MFLKLLSLTNFKNYEQAEIEFSPKINCFVGNNGVGKTNILDAIHYLSLTKSFFNNIDSANIRHPDEFFIISGTFNRDEEDNTIFCSFQRQKQKILKRNGKDYQRLTDHIGKYPVVMMSPADSVLITEGSEERRKFLNKIISQYNPEYLDAVLKYNKALLQRNRILKDGHFDKDIIDIWDTQLVKYGTYIYAEREKLVEELIPVFRENYSFISKGKELVSLNYRSHLKKGGFAELLNESVEKDKVLQYTTVGIHKDDLVFEMEGYPVKSIGSQGQQKSYLVALKLSKYYYIKGKSGYSPILLLDDIFDKFDADRVEQIIRLVGNHRFGQIFITDTHQDRLQVILKDLDTEHRLFRIGENGDIVDSENILNTDEKK